MEKRNEEDFDFVKYVEYLETKITKQQMSLRLKDMVIKELIKHIPESEMKKIGDHIKIEAPAA